MPKICPVFIMLGMLLYPLISYAEVGVNIGINLPVYPNLVEVPGYPVYYAPQLQANFFFYDGMYWVYQDDDWYTSSWYNGPWWPVDPEEVPLFVLRVPVYYYRQPPVFFIGWRSDAPPRWGDHWGHDWEQHRRGWDRWNRREVPAPAPLPVYQRQYSRDRYPEQVQLQQKIQLQHYRFQPRDPVARQYYQAVRPVQHDYPQQRGLSEERGARPQAAPVATHLQVQRTIAPRQEPPQNRMQPPVQHERRPAQQGSQLPRPQAAPAVAYPQVQRQLQEVQRQELPQNHTQSPVQRERGPVQQGMEAPHESGQERSRDRNE